MGAATSLPWRSTVPAGQVVVNGAYRPQGDPFLPRTRIAVFGGPGGNPDAYAHRGDTASLVWTQRKTSDEDDPTVQVAWRRPNGSWTGARQILAGGVVSGFDSNPLSDAVVIARSADGEQVWGITRTRGHRYAEPVQLSRSARPHPSSAQVAMDRHGNAVAAYLEEGDAGEANLVVRAYKAP